MATRKKSARRAASVSQLARTTETPAAIQSPSPASTGEAPRRRSFRLVGGGAWVRGVHHPAGSVLELGPAEARALRDIATPV